MIYEWLWLLLPIAVLAGWFLRDLSRRLRHLHKGAPSDEEFIRSLNFILSDQPDKAMDSFIGMFEVKSDTLNTHIILGNVYRRRGEIDRATRIHHNALMSLKPSDRQWATVSLELGRDYFRAGLFDRAEEIFKRVASSNRKEAQSDARRNLLDLYEAEKSWSKAIEPASQLLAEGETDYAKPLAHYHCELAEEAAAKNDIRAAYDHLHKATAAHKTLPRLLILEGDLKFIENVNHSALALWTQSLARNSGYAEILLPRIRKTFGDDKKGFADYIGGLKFSSLNTPYIYTYLRALLDAERTEDLHAWLRYLAAERRLPRVLADVALDSFLAGNRLDYAAFSAALDDAIANKKKVEYRCSHCGFEIQEHYWHCIACYHWDVAVLHDEVSDGL